MTSESVDEFRSRARAWLPEHLEPRAGGRAVRIRGATHTSVESIAVERTKQRKLFDGGFAGITWPAEYGGQGLTREHQAAFDEEAARYVLPDLGVAGGTTFGVCGPVMLQHASPDFLRRHVPRMLAGDELWCQFFSEPGAGSDLAGVTTRATRDGDRWILSGAKIWSSGAYYSDYGMCLARTDWDVPKHRGVTWFAVRTDAPGVTVRPIREINGEVEFCEEFFDDVELTDDDLIGEVNQGWGIAQAMLVFERQGTGTSGARSSDPGAFVPDLVGLARRLGRDQDPVVRQLIARAHTDDYVMTQLQRRVEQHLRKGVAHGAGIASYLKLGTGVTQARRARIGMEIGRGGALVWEEGDDEGRRAALSYLNGRVMAIAGGTNEMQRNGIGERVLGLPREPSFDTDRPFSEVVRNAAHWTGKV
jgi:alkylation response protein AidB-like acyl-CoA dehydrogenase